MRISDWSSDVCSSDLSDGWSHGWSGLGNGNSVMAAFRRPATLYVCLAFINFPLLDFDLKKPEIEIPTHELGKLARGWVGGIHYWNLLPQVRRDSLAIGEPRGAYKMPTKDRKSTRLNSSH